MKKIGDNKAIARIFKEIERNNIKLATELINKLHPADIADILTNLEITTAISITPKIVKKKLGETFIEIGESRRRELLDSLSDDYIIQNIIRDIPSDEASEIIEDLSKKRKQDILEKIKNIPHLKNLLEFLDSPKLTASSVMTKNLIKVNHKLSIYHSYLKIRLQSSKVKKINSIYVIDDNNKLLGRLQVKKILGLSPKESIENLHTKDIHYCYTEDELEKVADTMQKYNLHEMPVVNKDGLLVGCIELNEVLDFVKEEAEKDFQLASGLSEDVESKDKIPKIIRARVPWLLIGLIGGLLSAKILGFFDMERFIELAFFTPLIAAMGGNVGTQSSAIIVQWIASHPSQKIKILKTLLKELSIGIINASICSIFFFIFGFIFSYPIHISIVVSLSLFSVIIFASLFGTIFPLILNQLKIDPAIATGTFITVTNDIIGLLIYFILCNILLFT